MKNKKIVLGVVVCLAIAGLSFWGGMKYENTKSSSDKMANRSPGEFNFNQNGASRMGQNTRGGMGGGLVSGEVISMDDKSMTIKLRDGGSKIVFFSPSSKVEKTVDGVIADVAIGKSVMITGTANPDGSVSATSIQMRPALTIPNPIKTN